MEDEAHSVPMIELPDERIGLLCRNDLTIYITTEEYERLQPVIVGTGDSDYLKVNGFDGSELIVRRGDVVAILRSTAESREKYSEYQASFSMERQLVTEQLQARLAATFHEMQRTEPEPKLSPAEEAMKARMESGEASPIPIFGGPHGEQ